MIKLTHHSFVNFIRHASVWLFFAAIWIVITYALQNITGELFIKLVVDGQVEHTQTFFYALVVISIMAAFMAVRLLRKPWQMIRKQLPRWVDSVSRQFSTFLPICVLSYVLYHGLSQATLTSWHFFMYHHDAWVLITDLVSGIVSFALLRLAWRFWRSDRRRASAQK